MKNMFLPPTIVNYRSVFLAAVNYRLANYSWLSCT